MTRIFFYHNLKNRLVAACSLIEKAYGQGKGFVVYAPDPECKALIDRLLWTHPPLSFLPHCSPDDPLAPQTPILITDQLSALPPECARERLLNLDESPPPGFESFESLIEVVDQEESVRQNAKARVRHYKDSGCEVHFIDKTEN